MVKNKSKDSRAERDGGARNAAFCQESARHDVRPSTEVEVEEHSSEQPSLSLGHIEIDDNHYTVNNVIPQNSFDFLVGTKEGKGAKTKNGELSF